MDDNLNSITRTPGWGIRSADQVVVAALTAIAIAVIATSWIYRGGLRGRIIDIEKAEPTSVTFQLDINDADWPEWTLLPGVGAKLAQRIVLNRDEQGPFQSHEDLRRVPGIGPRTLDRMRPFLLPLTNESRSPEKEAVARQ